MIECVKQIHISTLNQGDYMNKSKFITRFKECYKEKGYTQEELAEKLNLSINGLKYYLRTKNDKLPPLDLLKRMAEILEVDTAYLLGEIDRKKNSLETVCKYTGLTENSVSLISSYRAICISLNRLFSTIYYEELFSLIADFIFTDSCTITIQENHKNKYYGSAMAERKMLKAQILNLFDKALDDMYFQPFTKDETASKEVCRELLNTINSEYGITDTNILYKKIAHMLDKIQELNHHEFILAYSPDKIISNRKLLNKLYDITEK